MLAWKLGFCFESIYVSKNQILGFIYLDPKHYPWLLSCVYGPPYFHEKKRFWSEFMGIGNKVGGPRLILGDVNFVLSNSERVGSMGKDQFLPFILQLIKGNTLIDMPIKGDNLTWDNHKEGHHHIKSVLDKALVNEDWLHIFPKAVIQSLQTSHVCKKIGATRLALSKWNREQFDKLDTYIGRLQLQLRNIQKMPTGSRSWASEMEADFISIPGYEEIRQALFTMGSFKASGLDVVRKDADFNFIMDNLVSKLHGWKFKSLSKAGHATLIKSVGLSLPVYTMQMIKLFKKLATKIYGMVRDFWGGLGFQRTLEMNQAFLAKWGWALLNKDNSLCCKVLSVKYLKGRPFLKCSYKNLDSWFWKNVVKAIEILKKGACKLTSDGKDTDIWNEPWVIHGQDFHPHPKNG
uniref:Reverse transcriptase n=1 Tax=Cannabis sativa TaxID=3483 RepID=A0A803PJJ1_CANSA